MNSQFKGSMEVSTPLNIETCSQLKAGDDVLISGVVFTMRDAAHTRMVELLEKDRSLPFDIKGAVIYYAGASPTPPGRIIGSIGPTTSRRMDAYTTVLLQAGLKGMIGKGPRSQSVIEAIKKYRAVYFGAVGGIGALLSKKVKSSKLIAFPDLGPEALYRLEICGFPAKVLTDQNGNDYYHGLYNRAF